VRTSILVTTRAGLGRVASLPGLLLTVWLIHLVMAATAVYPLWRSLRAVIGPLPESDVLGKGIPLGALADLAELEPGLIARFGCTVIALAVLGVLVGAAMTGGVIEVLRSRDDRPMGHRFGRGAGRFFGRFVGVGLLVAVVGGVMGALLLAPLAAQARASFRSTGAPHAATVLGAAFVAAAMTLLVLLVLDVSRIVVVRSDGGVFSSVRTGLGMVLRRPALWIGTWLVNAALVTLALGLYVLMRDAVPPSAPLLLLVILQQGLVVTRTGLRVGLLASESHLVDALAPVTPSPSAVDRESTTSHSEGLGMDGARGISR